MKVCAKFVPGGVVCKMDYNLSVSGVDGSRIMYMDDTEVQLL